jgi:hypothetical protein
MRILNPSGVCPAPQASKIAQPREALVRLQYRRGRASTKAAKGIGAGEGIRTLDPNLGKVVLYP